MVSCTLAGHLVGWTSEAEQSHARRARDRPFLTWWLYSRVPGDGRRYAKEIKRVANWDTPSKSLLLD